MSPRKFYTVLPLSFASLTLFAFTALFILPENQIIHSGFNKTEIQNERVYRRLVDSCDLYDDIDAIISLKAKHSQFELDQLLKEKTMREHSLQIENFKNFSEFK